MARCWEARGCDEELQSRCPHAESEEFRCPARCAYAHCDLARHQRTSDPALIFAPDIDRRAAAKEECTFCAFFLTRGPRV